MTQELAANFYATPDAIAGILQLPEGAYIDSVMVDDVAIGVLRFRIRGAGWPVAPGNVIPQTRPCIARHHDETGAVMRQTITWDFPS